MQPWGAAARRAPLQGPPQARCQARQPGPEIFEAAGVASAAARPHGARTTGRQRVKTAGPRWALPADGAPGHTGARLPRSLPRRHRTGWFCFFSQLPLYRFRGRGSDRVRAPSSGAPGLDSGEHACSAASMAPNGRHTPQGTLNAPPLAAATRASSPHAAALAPQVSTAASASSSAATCRSGGHPNYLAHLHMSCCIHHHYVQELAYG